MLHHNSKGKLAKKMMTFIRIICLFAFSLGGLAHAGVKNVFTYNVGPAQTIQLSIQFNLATNKTQIEVQLDKSGGKGQLFYQEITHVVEKMEIPEPSQVKSFDNQDKIIFDRNEFNSSLQEQNLFSIKLDVGSQSRLIVLPISENLKEIVQNKRPTVFDFYDGLASQEHLFRTYSFRLLTSENLLEKGLSIDPQLLFTYADHSFKDKDFSHSDLKLVAVDAQTSKTKVISITDSYVPINDVFKYPVTVSYSTVSKDYNYHIRLPNGGKIVKSISDRSQWVSANSTFQAKVNKGPAWGLDGISVSMTPVNSTFNFNPADEPGFGSRSPEIEEGKISIKEKSANKSQVNQSQATRPQGILEIAKYLQKFKTQVEEIVKGQPEAVDVLQKMEQKHQAEGLENSKPQVAWFLGMPGTGKDTLVEAFIEAKHKLVYPEKEVIVEDHIYRLPKLKEDKDLWSLTGSGTGYKGSDSLSPLVRWLVKHSGGRYYIKEADKSQEVHINPDWKPGQVLNGYYSPDEAVLFANELHDWSKMMINTFLKEALEKGFFEIGNAGKGVNRIQVPVNIIIASNHGIGKIAARDSDGKRVGKPLDFKSLEARWDISQKNKTALIEELKAPTPGNADGGCSEEILSRIPKSNIILLRPLSKEGVKYIAKFKLKKLTRKYAKQKANNFPQVNFQFDDSVLEFLASYDQIAEDGARIVDDKINDLIEKPLLDALISGKISIQQKMNLKVSVRQNKDTTYSLVVRSNAEQSALNLIIKGTLKEKAIQSISDQRIDELNSLEQRLNRRVKGAEHIIKELARDVRRSENSEKTNNPELNDRIADVYMFLGSSSTGKTELAVALHQEIYKTKDKPLVMDFGHVQTINDLKEKVLGKRDAKNAAVASDFMQEFDRRNGDLVVVFDEVANANPEVLKALFEILREPIVNFADNKPRSMGRVKIIMTGNAGEEWYQGIPRDIPDVEQYEAARKIYESSVGNDQFKRNFLMKKFSEALLNRVSLNRVYFFGPHTHKTIRELIQLKLLKAIDSFNEAKKGVRTWRVGFSSFNDYKRTIEAIEKYGFKIWEQGASITQFIDKQLINQLHDELLTRKVPQGSVVKISKLSDVESKKVEEGTKVNFELSVENQKESIPLSVRGKKMEKPVKQNPKDFILTAVHEAGHAFLSRALLGDKVRSQGVSIIPGVTEIDGQWVRYEGVAISEELEKMSMTREALINRIAVLLGGGVAESLATKNYKVTAGHQNDLQRASKIATRMVVEFGLSDYQGPSRQEGQSIEVYLNSLSAMQRRKIDKAVDQIRKEAQTLAESMLMAHFDSFIVPIAKSLAAKGEVRGEVLNRFFDLKSYQIYSIYDEMPMKKAIQQYKKQTKASSEVSSVTARRDFEFHDFMNTNSFKVFNLEEALKSKFYSQVSTVDLSQGQAYVMNESSLKQTLLAKRAQGSRMCLNFYRK